MKDRHRMVARSARGSHSVKFDTPGGGRRTGSAPSPCDSGLQSIDKRRRYMRRGSKSPSMFLLDAQQIKNLAAAEKEDLVDRVPVPFFTAESIVTGTSPTCSSSSYGRSHKERRMSLMTALKVNLERAAIVEPKVSQQIRRMSIEQKRSFTFELLSKV